VPFSYRFNGSREPTSIGHGNRRSIGLCSQYQVDVHYRYITIYWVTDTSSY